MFTYGDLVGLIPAIKVLNGKNFFLKNSAKYPRSPAFIFILIFKFQYTIVPNKASCGLVT
jgi:hypothetical protein